MLVDGLGKNCIFDRSFIFRPMRCIAEKLSPSPTTDHIEHAAVRERCATFDRRISFITLT